jgi:[ribosomal protein S5]-alanine N-acetyltransferase
MCAHVLETPRLSLREMVPGDLDFLATMLADPQVMRFYPKPLARSEAEGWLERQQARYASDGHGFWLVTERSSGLPVGQVGLLMQRVDALRTNPHPEIGYMLHRSHWGLGYATEAALGVRDYAFTQCGYSAVISLIRPENLPSRAVAGRLGMQVLAEATFAGLRHLVHRLARQ